MNDDGLHEPFLCTRQHARITPYSCLRTRERKLRDLRAERKAALNAVGYVPPEQRKSGCCRASVSHHGPCPVCPIGANLAAHWPDWAAHPPATMDGARLLAALGGPAPQPPEPPPLLPFSMFCRPRKAAPGGPADHIADSSKMAPSAATGGRRKLSKTLTPAPLPEGEGNPLPAPAPSALESTPAVGTPAAAASETAEPARKPARVRALRVPGRAPAFGWRPDLFRGMEYVFARTPAAGPLLALVWLRARRGEPPYPAWKRIAAPIRNPWNIKLRAFEFQYEEDLPW